MKKVIWVIIISSVVPLGFSILLFMEVMSAFGAEGVLKSPECMKGEQTKIYASIQEIMVPYYEELRGELADERRRSRDAHVKVVYPQIEEEDSNDSTETETEAPNPIYIWPTVLRRINYIPENVIISYLLMNDGIDIKNASVNRWKLNSFIERISENRERLVVDAEEKKTYWVENRLLTINEIADNCFSNESDKKKFFIMCDAYGEYFEIKNPTVILEDDSEVDIAIEIESMSNVPLYLQYDSTWKNVSYGNGTIGRNGCCPTCLAMVFSYFHGRGIYPTEVVAWAGSRYYVSGEGTTWSIFEPAAAHWNISCVNIGKDAEKMADALRQGKLVVASMGPGTFTKGGHFIVLTGITESGKIKVNDPNDSTMKNHAAMEFAVSLIIRECKNLWVFG